MDHATIAEIAVLIEQKLEDMSQKDRLGESSQDTVELDQQAVGRLSRMDALQSQAMVQAQQRRRDAQRTALNFALKRISEGELIVKPDSTKLPDAVLPLIKRIGLSPGTSE